MIAYENIFPSQGPKTNSDGWNIEQLRAHKGRSDARSLSVIHYCRQELTKSLGAAKALMDKKPASERAWRLALIDEIEKALA